MAWLARQEIPDEHKAKLEARAKKSKDSMASEVRKILAKELG